MKHLTFFILYMLAALSVNAQQIETVVDHDEAFDFTGYSSFTFVEEIFSAETEPKILALYSMIKNSILYEMDIREIVLDDSTPDFFINYEIYSENQNGIAADTDDHPPFRYMRGDEDLTMEEVLTEGTIIVSVIDNASGEPVWEGYAVGVVDIAEENLRTSQVRIRKSVHQLVKEFDKTMKNNRD